MQQAITSIAGHAHPLTDLATFTRDLHRSEIPDDVISRAKLMVLDLLGVIVAGSTEERVRKMASALRLRGSVGRSFVVGEKGSCDAADAAMINATAGCLHVLEDGHKYARGHLSNNVIPAILAVAEERQVSGLEFLTTFVAGYEVAARVTMACRIRHEMHSSGTTATIGATAGVARLMGLTADAIREAMNVAAPLTLATSWNAAEDGATVRDIYAGKGGANAVWAPRWVEAGFTGAEDDVSFVFGHVTSDRFDTGSISRELRSEWEIRRSYFKIHSCCRTIQSAIDAALDIKKKNTFDPAEIASVLVETFQMPVNRNSRREARNEIAAKESEPISLALVLLHGHCNETLFTHERVFADETTQLISKIEIKCDPALDALYPELQPARVKVALRDGRRFESYYPVAVGDPAIPLGPTDIEAKFFRLTHGLMGDRAAELRAAVDRLDELSSITELTNILRTPHRSG